MTNIIRNCIHSNDVYIGIRTDGNSKPISVVRKSFSRKGVARIHRELEGLKYYCDRRGLAENSQILDFNCQLSYGYLELTYHDGTVGDYFQSLVRNKLKILNVFDHYIKLKKEGAEFTSHGDLSLGNVVFNGDEVEWIIDWENSSSLVPFEYDLVYLLAQNCFFLKYSNNLSSTDLDMFQELLQVLRDRLDVPAEAVDSPSLWCRDIGLEYIEKSGIENSKCPFISTPESELAELDALLTRMP